MPVNLSVCHVTVLADTGLLLLSGSTGASASNRMLTAVDLMATGVIVKRFLNV